MQRPDEKKRELITATAAKMFATRPFHKVRLDDIAAAARIGKGTLYIYFDNKEELYFSLIYDGFARLVDRLREQLGQQVPPASSVNGHRKKGDGRAAARGAGSRVGAAGQIRTVVGELVAFAFAHPHFFELMRAVGTKSTHSKLSWDEKGRELTALIEQAIRRGVEGGDFIDPHPGLTALCIPGMVRSVMLFGPKGLRAEQVTAQILRLLESGIGSRERRGKA